MSNRIHLLGLTAFLALASMPAFAQIVIDMTDRGWYANNGLHNADNQNTITGPGYRDDTNSWFVFNLSSVQPNVCAATLRLEMEAWDAGSTEGTSSIWDVSTDPAVLVQSHDEDDAEGIAINDDLESGVSYASKTVYQTDVGSIVEFVFSAQGVNDINAAAGGLFAVGTHLTAADQATWLRWSGGEEQRTHQLVLETDAACIVATTPVPIPRSAWLIISTLLLLLGMAAIRQRAQA